MSQGDFTKEEAKRSEEALDELFGAVPKGKRAQYLGHLNDIALFLDAAKKAAPSEKK